MPLLPQLVEQVVLLTLPVTSLQPKSQLTRLDNELQNIINSASLVSFEKAQTYDQILKKYLAVKQKGMFPSGGDCSFSNKRSKLQIEDRVWILKQRSTFFICTSNCFFFQSVVALRNTNINTLLQ